MEPVPGLLPRLRAHLGALAGQYQVVVHREVMHLGDELLVLTSPTPGCLGLRAHVGDADGWLWVIMPFGSVVGPVYLTADAAHDLPDLVDAVVRGRIRVDVRRVGARRVGTSVTFAGHVWTVDLQQAGLVDCTEPSRALPYVSLPDAHPPQHAHPGPV